MVSCLVFLLLGYCIACGLMLLGAFVGHLKMAFVIYTELYIVNKREFTPLTVTVTVSTLSNLSALIRGALRLKDLGLLARQPILFCQPNAQ
jgi:hypothetical protein